MINFGPMAACTLIERGYVYIAQPPLYKAKHGKQERYLKDEAEKDEFLLGLAVDKARIESAGRVIEGAELAKTARKFLKARSTIAQESRVIDAAVLRALLDVPAVSLADEAAAQAAIAALSAVLQHEEVALEHITGQDGGHFLKITRKLHGNVMVSYLDQKFLDSKAYQTLSSTAAALAALELSTPLQVIKGDAEPLQAAFPVPSSLKTYQAQTGFQAT